MTEHKPPKEYGKITIGIEVELYQQLSLIALRNKTSRTDEFNRFLKNGLKIDELHNNGHTVFSRTPDGVDQEIEFSNDPPDFTWNRNEG